MTPERWQQVEELFHSALAREPGQWATFLAQACAGDESLLREVESLISFHDQSDSFIETPASDVAAELLAKRPTELEAGQQIAYYKILSSLGSGGMGEVYLAEDTRLGRRIALKLLPAQFTTDAERVRRFEQEARAASGLNHPNIVTIHEIGRADSTHFIATEFIDGETLRDHHAGRAVKLNEALDIATQVASALEAAHAAGIVHRDIKPENVMLRRDRIVKVLDFGLAKLALPQVSAGDTQAQTRPMVKTNPGVLMGTVQYMSPEQARGQEVDARTDIWSLGIVLYEMVTGRVPFEGETPSHVIVSILESEPPPLARYSEVPVELQRIVTKALRKDREERYQTTSELSVDLKSLKQELEVEARVNRSLQSDRDGRSITTTTSSQAAPITSSAKHQPRRAAFGVVVAVLVMTLIVLVAGSLTWFFKRSAKVRWAREQAIPEITKLISEDKYAAAVALAREAEKYISDDPVWGQLWPQMSMGYSIITTPPGADVYLREYGAVDREWEYFGKSPIERIQIPLGFVRWRIEETGFHPVEGGSGIFPIPTKPGERGEIRFTLDKAESFSPDMVRVTGGVISPAMANIPPYPVTLADYLIDRYEVTNKQFKEFVAAGGYQKREYWKHGFVKAGRALTWEEAMQEFHDATGRGGPASWELGDFPAGQDDYPVGGVSWYEAAAFAEFARKSLPTLYHWIGAATRFRTTAAGAAAPLAISPQSNFGGRGPASVGVFKGVGPYGTYDMAGNVREWCWNESADQRYVMGGSWNEPAYMFDVGYSLSPFDRSSINGFRCVRYLSTDALPEAAVRPLAVPWRDYSKEKPASDGVFRVYQSLYSSDRSELNPVIEAVDESADHWVKQKVTFNAAYGNERMIAYLFLPRNAAPPYQTVLWLQGVEAFNQPSFPGLPGFETDFLMKSGRALLVPIYKGTFERQDGFRMVPPYTTASFRDHMIQWSKDLGRSIDYLESRPDIAHDKLAYYGASSGAVIGSVVLALEPRIKTGVFLAGGLMMYELHPQCDPLNFVSRIKIPILMLNGRYDFLLPYEASQQPLFRLLGTPEKDKRHRTFETQHFLFPRNELIKEVLDWLDRYLGPVQ